MRKRILKTTVRQVNPASFIKKLAHSFFTLRVLDKGSTCLYFKGFSHGQRRKEQRLD